MFIWSPISKGLEFWSEVFENVKFLGKISNNWPNDLLGKNVYKTLEFC